MQQAQTFDKQAH